MTASWIVSSKDLAAGRVSWSPRENLRRMKAELVAGKADLASEVEIEGDKAVFRIRLDDSLSVRDIIGSARKTCIDAGLEAEDVDISVSGGYVKVAALVKGWTGFGEETTETGRFMKPVDCPGEKPPSPAV